MKKLVLFLAILFSASALGQSRPGAKYGDFCLICVDRLALDAARIMHKRDPYFPEYEHSDWNNHAALIWNISILEHAFWDNNVFMNTDNYQVREVGWEWRAGLDFKYFELFHYHLSRHVLEESRDKDLGNGMVERGNYPLTDYYGVRFNIIGGR